SQAVNLDRSAAPSGTWWRTQQLGVPRAATHAANNCHQAPGCPRHGVCCLILPNTPKYHPARLLVRPTENPMSTTWKPALVLGWGGMALLLVIGSTIPGSGRTVQPQTPQQAKPEPTQIDPQKAEQEKATQPSKE